MQSHIPSSNECATTGHGSLKCLPAARRKACLGSTLCKSANRAQTHDVSNDRDLMSCKNACRPLRAPSAALRGRTWNLQTLRHVFGMCKQKSSRRTLGIGRLAGRDPSAKPVHCRHGWAGFPAHPVRPCRPTGSERLSEQRLRGHPQGRCFPFDFIDKLFHAAVYGGFIPHMARAFFPYGNARWWG